MKTPTPLAAFTALACLSAAWPAGAQSSATVQKTVATIPVTVDNFIRAESDRYIASQVQQGNFGKFKHYRDFVPLDKVTVVRINRDTLYSVAAFDFDAGPVTVTLPDAGGRYLSMMTINQDHAASAAVYQPGPHTLTREKVGTRYALVGIRILLDPTDPQDYKKVHALQDAIQWRQEGTGRFEVPAWDAASLKKMRDALLVLGKSLPDSRGMFGSKEQVAPVRHLVGSAMAWGGNNEKDALYLNVTPPRNDGNTVYRMRVKDVPVDGFWSISVYDADGWFQPNPYNAYVLNNITAKKGTNGTIDIQFGGCDGKVVNCLPTPPNWNYMVRLYRPRAEVLSGQWTFPAAQLAGD